MGEQHKQEGGFTMSNFKKFVSEKLYEIFAEDFEEKNEPEAPQDCVYETGVEVGDFVPTYPGRRTTESAEAPSEVRSVNVDSRKKRPRCTRSDIVRVIVLELLFVLLIADSLFLFFGAKAQKNVSMPFSVGIIEFLLATVITLLWTRMLRPTKFIHVGICFLITLHVFPSTMTIFYSWGSKMGFRYVMVVNGLFTLNFLLIIIFQFMKTLYSINRYTCGALNPTLIRWASISSLAVIILNLDHSHPFVDKTFVSLGISCLFFQFFLCNFFRQNHCQPSLCPIRLQLCSMIEDCVYLSFNSVLFNLKDTYSEMFFHPTPRGFDHFTHFFYFYGVTLVLGIWIVIILIIRLS